jgi:hypothetical protein
MVRRSPTPATLLTATLTLLACDDGGGTPASAVCGPATCASAPAPSCEGNVRVAWQAIGICSVSPEDTAQCSYPELQRQDCAASAEPRVCREGQCVTPPVVPCEGVVCDDPPPPSCEGEVSRIFESIGTCDPTRGPAGECVYDVEASLDCASIGRPCTNGSCADPEATPCDPNPCDVPPAGTCARLNPQRYADSGSCTARGSGFDAYSCTYELNEFTECSGATPVCAAGHCASGVRAPAAAGELVIHEVLVNPADADDLGEWFELYNPTTTALDLAGCLLTDLVYDNVQLANGEDALALLCGGTLIDRVSWERTRWPIIRPGVAMQLKTGAANAAANDQPESWCPSQTPYGNRQNSGSPRRANPTCP